MSGLGWQLVADWRALGADERELLVGELWCHPIAGLEERADDVVVGFESESDARAAAVALTVPSKVVAVADDGYLDEWRRFARPWRVDKLFVRPSWIDAVAPSELIEIVIDPQRAFGSGAHASTRLALELMQTLDLRGTAVLDVGCGSGVLSIAAAVLGAARVEAIDIAGDAVAATVENARRNAVESRVRASVATIDDVAGDFDVVVVNVLPSVHRELVQGVRRAARHLVIVAGMLEQQATAVETAYGATRLTLRREDGWTALVLRVDRAEPGS